ncbi:MAG TPA: hypothetical protein VGE98_02495 [Thermoanaerobaculia bacterium]
MRTLRQISTQASLLRLIGAEWAPSDSEATLLCSIEGPDGGKVLILDLEAPAPSAAAKAAPSIVGQVGWRTGLRLAFARLLTSMGGGSLDAAVRARLGRTTLSIHVRLPLGAAQAA